MNSSTLNKKFSPLFNTAISDIGSVSGGDISSAFFIRLVNSETFFLKVNSNPSALDMFQQEKAGLEAIEATNTIAVPEVVGIESINQDSFLILEYIATKPAKSVDLERFGKQLAEMHDQPGTFNGWNSDNYIGSLEQCNDPETSWVLFYAKQRLQAQFELAISKKFLTSSEVPDLETSIQVLKSIIPNEDKSLLHGDLWSGNYLINDQGKAFLIDPAVFYGDKMVDIAMSALFGGFGQAFYDSYFYWTPKPGNYRERLDIYQLYYLLVHLNLFGRSYYKQVRRILDRYF